MIFGKQTTAVLTPPPPDDAMALAFARKAIMGGGVIGAVSCAYGLIFAGPTGSLSSYELVMLPFMGIFSTLMIFVFGLNNRNVTKRTGVAFSIWLGFYTTSNLAYEIFNQPEFGNALIYIVWMPATYLYVTAVADLKTSMKISWTTVGIALFVLASFLVTRAAPLPGTSHVFDALVVGIMAQPAMLAVIFGVARYREYYVHEHAKLEQLTANIAALEASARQARQGRREAERAHAAKSQFLTNVTHELRTPLNGILGLTEILQSRPGYKNAGSSSGDNLKYLDAIRDSGETLLALVEDVIALSQIESGGFTLNETITNLEACLSEVRRAFQDLPEAKDHSLEISLESDLPDLLVDPEILVQMCLALLSNAAKFSPEHSTIDLRVFPGGTDDGDEEGDGNRDLIISIQDQGIGIPNSMLPRLGSPFLQADDSNSRQRSGLGLGLALTKSRIEAHDGRLTFETAPGGGTLAKLIFPAARLTSADTDENIKTVSGQ